MKGEFAWDRKYFWIALPIPCGVDGFDVRDALITSHSLNIQQRVKVT